MKEVTKMVDIVTTIVQTGSQFLSTITSTVTVGGQSFLDGTINLLSVYASAVLAGLHM
jgi:hypothetical protein